MKVAIIYDWLVNYGGAERCLEIFHELFPEAPIYTSVYDKSKLPKSFSDLDVRSSFINNLPFAKKRYRDYLPLMPIAFEQFDLNEYDLVLSLSHACAKGVIISPSTCHICFCFTPMRYAWDMYHEYINIENIGWFKKKIIPFIMSRLRIWDFVSSNRVDYFIAISSFIAERIKKYYKRDSRIIYPPIETSKFIPSDKIEDYFLAVSRLVPQKRVDIIVKAFNKLELPLKIIGSGRELDRLKKMSNSNIEFLGFQNEEKVAEYMSKCRALVFASREDFGIVPLEAQSCGRPVIAYGAGGTKETVIPGKTGILFYEQTTEAVIEAVRKFEQMTFDSRIIREFALKFDKVIFKEKIKNFIEEKFGKKYEAS